MVGVVSTNSHDLRVSSSIRTACKRTFRPVLTKLDMMIVNAEYSYSSQSTRCQVSEFGIFGYLARRPPLFSHYIHASRQDYIYAAHRLPLPPLGPVGLVRAVVAAVATATGVLADTTGATETALLTADATGAALTAAGLVATSGRQGQHSWRQRKQRGQRGRQR